MADVVHGAAEAANVVVSEQGSEVSLGKALGVRETGIPACISNWSSPIFAPTLPGCPVFFLVQLGRGGLEQVQPRGGSPAATSDGGGEASWP